MQFNGQPLALLENQPDAYQAHSISRKRAREIIDALNFELNKQFGAGEVPSTISLLLRAQGELLNVQEVIIAASMAASMVILTVGTQQLLPDSPEDEQR